LRVECIIADYVFERVDAFTMSCIFIDPLQPSVFLVPCVSNPGCLCRIREQIAFNNAVEDLHDAPRRVALLVELLKSPTRAPLDRFISRCLHATAHVALCLVYVTTFRHWIGQRCVLVRKRRPGLIACLSFHLRATSSLQFAAVCSLSQPAMIRHVTIIVMIR